MARILITSAIPYINGIKHLGNLVGSQLPADLYARYMRMSIADATATLEEEHDEVVRAWDRHYAARDRAEAGGQA